MLETVNALLWGPGTLGLFLGTGAVLTLRSGALPQRSLGRALRLSLGREAHQKGAGGVSPFGALMTALAATVGTGNIVGVAAALTAGGPGALVWMMAAAALGMAAKYAECALSVRYRRRDAAGRPWGGPMAVMEARLGLPGKILGRCFALFALLMAFSMGAAAQSGAMADTLRAAYGVPRLWTGGAAAVLTGIVLAGGAAAVARSACFFVPVMALLYLAGGAAVIVTHLDRLPAALWQMLHCAFAPEAALGGALGTVTRREALRWGVARGVFSNEAGLGSAAVSAACADTDSPVRQGLIGMTGVFFDTCVLCAVTGLAICTAGVLGAEDGAGVPLTGAALTIRAFETALGPWAPRLIALSLSLFAFTTILGCAVQAEVCAVWLFGGGGRRWCRRLYCLWAGAGALLPMGAALSLADLCNALMALPNLLCLLLLSGEAADMLRQEAARSRPAAGRRSASRRLRVR